MNDSMDFLMQPVLEGLCRYESINDGTLDLRDFAIMNDALMVQYENKRRAAVALEAERKS